MCVFCGLKLRRLGILQDGRTGGNRHHKRVGFGEKLSEAPRGVRQILGSEGLDLGHSF